MPAKDIEITAEEILDELNRQYPETLRIVLLTIENNKLKEILDE